MTEEHKNYFESKEFKQLLTQYETSVKSGHLTYIDADDLADIADYYQMNGRTTDAGQAISLALQINPEAVGPLLYKAREALNSGNFDKAREYAEHLRGSDSLEHLYLQGEILICEGKVTEADDLFRQHFLTISPDEVNDFVYDVGNLFKDYELYDKAFEWAVRSKGDDSDDFKELMAYTLFGLEKYEDSARLFNELIDHHPYSKRYWTSLANVQFMCEEYSDSINSSEFAIAIDPNYPESILAKANGLYRLENYEEALAWFERYSALIDDDEYGHLHQGSCLINLGRHEEAIKRLEHAKEVALDDSPYLPEIYQELAFAYCEHKEPELALYYIDKTSSQNCDHIDLEVIRGHILLANNRPDEAQRVFKKAIVDSGYSPKTMLRCIVSMYDNGYAESAYHLFKKFFNYANSAWTDGYSYMALCCWDLYREKEFLYYLQKAVDKNPQEARTVLGNLFPKGMEPSEYVSFIKNKLENNRK